MVLILGGLTTGCQTTIGNYFGNRARDFGESFLVQVGVAPGLGVDVKAAGLLHVCAISVTHVPDLTVGWVYGAPRPVRTYSSWMEGDLGWLSLRRTQGGWHETVGARDHPSTGHACYWFLPALFSWANGAVPEEGWLWSEPDARWQRVHAFDVEVGVSLIFVGGRVGFSPGEFLDFLLGWVGIDIAGDDRALDPGAERPLEPEPPDPRPAPVSPPTIPGSSQKPPNDSPA